MYLPSLYLIFYINSFMGFELFCCISVTLIMDFEGREWIHCYLNICTSVFCASGHFTTWEYV